MTLTQTLRGMAQYLSATADPIDRERWAMTLRDTADALATAQAERSEALMECNCAVLERDAALQRAEQAEQERDALRATPIAFLHTQRIAAEQRLGVLSRELSVAQERIHINASNWEQQRQRAEQAEAALAEARRVLREVMRRSQWKHAAGCYWQHSGAVDEAEDCDCDVRHIKAALAAVLAQEEPR